MATRAAVLLAARAHSGRNHGHRPKTPDQHLQHDCYVEADRDNGSGPADPSSPFARAHPDMRATYRPDLGSTSIARSIPLNPTIDQPRVRNPPLTARGSTAASMAEHLRARSVGTQCFTIAAAAQLTTPCSSELSYTGNAPSPTRGTSYAL